MAASTSSAVDSNNYFDVFINHRGPDVKKTFASDLYRLLISYGLRVFLDYQEMQEGEDLNRQIQGAIKTASVHVAIFTPNYAKSKWCLDELVLMLESEAPIIPVFHNVKPDDLRWTQGGEGVYARSLLNLKNKRTHESQPRYTSDTIEKWRNALSRVAGISGLELEKFDGDEGKLVDKVVEVVLKKGKNTQLNVAIHPTGLDEMVEDFVTKVSLHQHSGTVQIVGITGLGGAGKTTLAKELFNRNRSNYSKSCFLFDVRENAKNPLHLLQKSLLKSLSGSEQPINSKDEGTEKLKKHFRVLSSPVLLVLDDVDHEDQVYELLPVTDIPLPPNSLILITSRDKKVLLKSGKVFLNSGVQKPSIYQLTGLNTELSRELFCSHAFCQPHPLSGFEHLVSRFLTACDGLPLSLKVFGGHLYGNIDKSSWEDELEKLQRILPQEIQKRLQISFDALPKDEQQIFLDIACFFIGENRDTAIRVWDGSGWKGLLGFQSLQNKCLVEVEVEVNGLGGKTGTFIRMHDHLRDMGRELAKHPGWPLRLWDGTKNIDDLLQQSSEKTAVRGIRMLRPVGYHTEYASSDDDDFSDYQMKYLRLLDIEIKEDLLKCLLEGVGSRSLFWFRWRNCPCSSLPPILMKKLGALRVLEVNGNKLETLWPEELQAPLQLRELRISCSLSEIPKSIERLKYLEHIDLSHCCGLERLPDSFGNLIQLKYLDLTYCYRLSSLPDSFGNLSTLEHIDLSYCDGLERLPDSFGNLIQLKYLDLSDCDNLTASTGTFGRMSMLEYIYLPNCHFEVLPSQIACQWPQEKLHLWLMNLKEWPSANGLEKLVLVTQLFLETLPPSLGRDLRNLKSLELRSGQSLKRLPGSFLLSNQLIDLIVKDCSLRELHFKAIEGNSETLTDTEVQRTSSNLEGCLLRLQHLALHNIQISEVSFPTGVCPNLQHLDIRECKDLVEVGALPNALVKLQLYGCSKLRKIDASFPKGVYPKLQHLDIGDCQDLVEVGTFSTALVKLQMIGCPKLRKIAEQLCGFAKLQTPDVSRSKEVEELPSIEGKNETVAESRGQRTRSNLDSSFDKCLLSLQHLEPYNTEISEVSFPTGVCPNLKYLIINNGDNLVRFEKIEKFSTGGFGKLELSNCSKLRKIEELCGLGNLQILIINWCKGLEELSIMETLVSLEELRVRQCWTLKSIRGLAHLKKLRELDVSGCSELEDLPGVEHLWSLEKLWACCCKKLKSIRVSAQLTQLRELNVSECSELEELPGVEHLRSLEKMQVHSCVKLKGILGLSQLRQLRELHVSFCHGLEELLGVGHLKSLEVLQACGCVKLKSIQGLEQLTQLRELDVSYCYELEELPGVEHLRSLDRLKACNCVKLKSIGWLAQMTKLLELDVSDCFELEELPGLEHLRSLKVLKTCKCVKMKSIQGLAKLIQLRKLDVSGCCVLEDMRDVGYLQSLLVLQASECVKLKSIQGLEQMTQLQKLDVSYCFELEELPGIERLRSLIKLQARSCKKLKSIQVSAQLTQLRELDVSFCSELEEMPGVGYLESLVVLRASECVKLTSLWALAQLTQLQELDVSGCSELEEMSDVGYLQSLLVLRASDCVKLKSIHGSAQLTQLLKLDVSRCRGLEELGGVGHLKSLKMLRASGCVKLKSIQVLEQLTQLLELDVCNCFELEELLGVEHLKSLKELLASSCKKLKSIQGLAQLTQLQYLDVSGCYELEVMPGVGHLQSLVMLRASECMRLKWIQGLEQMTQLRELDVSFCFELEELPNVGYLHSLEVLKASACVKLKNIQGLAQLTQLRELDVSFCSELEEMPGVGYLQSLVVLKACACVKLKNIQGLAQLTQLRELDVSFCSEL